MSLKNADDPDFEAHRLAGERMVEVEDGRGFVEFAQEACDPPVTRHRRIVRRAEFDQRIHLEFHPGGNGTARDALDKARVVLAEGIRRPRVRRRDARRHPSPSRQASSEAASWPPPICSVAGDMSKVLTCSVPSRPESR